MLIYLNKLSLLSYPKYAHILSSYVGILYYIHIKNKDNINIMYIIYILYVSSFLVIVLMSFY